MQHSSVLLRELHGVGLADCQVSQAELLLQHTLAGRRGLHACSHSCGALALRVACAGHTQATRRPHARAGHTPAAGRALLLIIACSGARADGSAHSVLLLKSNAMDVVLSPDRVSWRMT